MFDWNRVTQLREEIGEADFGEVVALFLEEVDEVIVRLGAGFDPETLAADFHFLKGSALNLGFLQFATLCQKGESAERSDAADQGLVSQVIVSYETSRAAFLEKIDAPLQQAI